MGCNGKTSVLRELDILDVLRVDRREAGLNLGVAQAKIVALPAVEFQRHLAHRRVAAAIDIVERRLDDRPYLVIGGGSLFTADPTFQYLRHQHFPFVFTIPDQYLRRRSAVDRGLNLAYLAKRQRQCARSAIEVFDGETIR